MYFKKYIRKNTWIFRNVKRTENLIYHNLNKEIDFTKEFGKTIDH